MRSSYSGSVIGPKMSTCTLPRMFMPAPWITRTLGIALSVRTGMVGILPAVRVDSAASVAETRRWHTPDSDQEDQRMITTDVYPGKDLGTLELTITDEMVQHYIKGLDEPNPWYTTASPFGGPVAPVIVYQQADSEFKGWYLDNLFGNLWRRQEWEIYAPTRVGQVLRCSARVADRYRRRDREIVAQEMSVRDEAGDLVARSVHHQSFLAEQTSGEVALRDPASKEGAKQGDELAGEPLSLELRKTFTEAMCNEFFYRSTQREEGSGDEEQRARAGWDHGGLAGRAGRPGRQGRHRAGRRAGQVHGAGARRARVLRVQRIRELADGLHQSQRKAARRDPRQPRDDQGLPVRHSRQRQAVPRRLQDGEGPLEPEEARDVSHDGGYGQPA